MSTKLTNPTRRKHTIHSLTHKHKHNNNNNNHFISFSFILYSIGSVYFCYFTTNLQRVERKKSFRKRERKKKDNHYHNQSDQKKWTAEEQWTVAVVCQVILAEETPLWRRLSRSLRTRWCRCRRRRRRRRTYRRRWVTEGGLFSTISSVTSSKSPPSISLLFCRSAKALTASFGLFLCLSFFDWFLQFRFLFFWIGELLVQLGLEFGDEWARGVEEDCECVR